MASPEIAPPTDIESGHSTNNTRNASEEYSFDFDGTFRTPAIREWRPYEDETVAECKLRIAADVDNRKNYYRNLHSLSLLTSLQ